MKREDAEQLTLKDAIRFFRKRRPLTGYPPGSGQVCEYSYCLSIIEQAFNRLELTEDIFRSVVQCEKCVCDHGDDIECFAVLRRKVEEYQTHKGKNE